MGEQALSAPGKKKYEYLDVIRSITVYLIIACHSSGFIENDPALVGTPLWWVADGLNVLGHVGVSIFFMVSGFLLLSDPRTLDVGQFYRRRLTRLLPPFLIWDVVYYLQKCVMTSQPPNIDTFFKEFALQGSAIHLWYVYQIVGLYLLMPFLKRMVDHCTRKELLALLTVVLLQPTLMRCVNILQAYVWVGPFQALMEGYVGFLLVGYLLGTVDLGPKARAWIYGLGLVGLVWAIVGNYCFSQDGTVVLPFNEGYAITQYMIGAALFLLVKQTAGKLPALARRWAGKLSPLTYGIYLSHIFVLEWCWYASQRGWCSGFSNLQHLLVRFLLTAVISTGINWFFSRVPALKKYLL